MGKTIEAHFLPLCPSAPQGHSAIRAFHISQSAGKKARRKSFIVARTQVSANEFSTPRHNDYCPSFSICENDQEAKKPSRTA
jgi:hypothetical protein